MREIRQSGSEGGVALTTPSLPLSGLMAAHGAAVSRQDGADVGNSQRHAAKDQQQRQQENGNGNGFLQFQAE